MAAALRAPHHPRGRPPVAYAMPSLVTYHRDGRIGHLTFDHPPVNAISRPVVAALRTALGRFDADSEAAALVLSCEGRTFVAGGDIADFELPDFSAQPFNALLARLEAAGRPVVAALHGTVLGGGLELAMACHHRVAHPSTRLGLPEIKLGLLPGSLGTQRLPRLLGAQRALEMILSGESLEARQALEAGLVDALSQAPPAAAGAAAAQALLAARAPIRRTGSLAVAPVPSDFFQAAGERAARQPAYPAPVGARDVIERGKSGGLPPAPAYRAVVRRLHELGRHGQKAGAGYYRYDGGRAVADPALTAIVRSLARAHGIARREGITRQEIVERLFFPLVNEGLKILEEGIALRPGDIDVVWVAGYGFPHNLGGPMFMADQTGLAVIAQRLAHHGAQRGNAFGYWSPSLLLTRLVEAGVALKDWKNEE